MPGAVPAPLQVWQTTAVSTLIGASIAERGLVQVELQPQDRVGAGPGARAWSARGRVAEERVHDVLEADERAGAGAGRAARPERIAAEVDDLALLRVGQHLVRGVDLLELLLRRRVGVDVRVELPGQLPVGALDVVRGGVPAYPQDAVVVLGHLCPYALARRSAPCALIHTVNIHAVNSAPAPRRRSVPRPAPSR